MERFIYSPTEAMYWFIPGNVLFLILPLLGVTCFTYFMFKRLAPLMKAQPDFRFNQLGVRLVRLIQLWLAQWKMPRYIFAGVIHIVIFAGFITLSIGTFSLLMSGIVKDFVMPGFSGIIGHIYAVAKAYAATGVCIAIVIAGIRRGIFKPKRYVVPEQYGEDHTTEAIFILTMIGIIVSSESLIEAVKVVVQTQQGQAPELVPPLTLLWFFKNALMSAPIHVLQNLLLWTQLAFELTFLLFLCFLPVSKHFHVITSIFNVFFMKLDRGSIKPVKWGITDEQVNELGSFGIKKMEDFTWKHRLDFYTCADCGRCSDNCPANAAGRPLSPRFLTLKARNYGNQVYPFIGEAVESKPLIGTIYKENEIWSCTTCGACEEECPLTIEYIDKIVDMRRGLVDEGNVPQSLQKPLQELERRGNPYGRPEKNRGDWTKDKSLMADVKVKILNGKDGANTLYFVDSITSYDERIQGIARATARILHYLGRDFGILGVAEKDSGHEVRRFGEEMLFMSLRDQNLDAIKESGAECIVTADPHAYNALKNDYRDMPPVEHISQVIAKRIKSGELRLDAAKDSTKVYTFQDPCYLGRHNQIYEDPRNVLDSIPGLRRVEMSKSRDRSFCCGGGGLMLFYESEEEQRMGVLRVRMAAEAGANVIVTACPFCMVNIEDAIKVAGMEGKMEVIDLVELVEQHLPNVGDK